MLPCFSSAVDSQRPYFIQKKKRLTTGYISQIENAVDMTGKKMLGQMRIKIHSGQQTYKNPAQMLKYHNTVYKIPLKIPNLGSPFSANGYQKKKEKKRRVKIYSG